MRFLALPTDTVRALRAGAPDAHRRAPERAVSDGGDNPCRHCLTEIPEGRGMLVLAHRPFTTPQPYAESGPIFLCADARVAFAHLRSASNNCCQCRVEPDRT